MEFWINEMSGLWSYGLMIHHYIHFSSKSFSIDSFHAFITYMLYPNLSNIMLFKSPVYSSLF